MGAIVQNEFQRENILLSHRISDSAVTVEPAQRTDKHAFDKLAWLENQVAPTVRTLKKLGYEQELREIFGLTSEG
jgi:hypothetical protein